MAYADLMRFAFKTSPQNTTWADMLAVWKAADDIDVFESGWTFDHFYPIFSRRAPARAWRAGPRSTALAQATTRLRLGHARDRHPLPAPGGAGQHGGAPLDIISGRPARARHRRRVERGGVRRLRHRARHACASASTASTRRARCIDRPAHRRRPPTFDGSYYQLTDARCEPKPVAAPHPPICIGGSGEKRTLRTVARYAQHWNFVGGTPGGVRPQARRAPCALRRDRP